MKLAENLMARAAKAHQAGQIDEAEKAYVSLLKLNRSNGDALRLLGGLYIQTNRFQEAEACLNEAMALQPRNAEIHNNLGLTLRNLGRRGEAAQHYKRAVQMNPAYLTALRNLGSLYFEMGHPSDALPFLQRAITIAPDDPKTHFYLGNTFRALGRPNEAIPAYLKALNLKTDYREAMINLGLAYAEAGHEKMAIDWHTNALKTTPNDIQAMNNLANIYRQSGDAQKAFDLFEIILTKDPFYTEAWINYAMVLRDLGHIDEAAESCRRALALETMQSSTAAAAYVNLGTLAQDKMRHEDALACFQKALQHMPALPDAVWNSALSLLSLGRYKEGWAAYESGIGHKHLRGPALTPEKRWNGEPFEGKKLVLWSEQGYGDTIQFIRYASLCKRRGGTVLALAPQPLKRLAQNCAGIDDIAENVQESDYDLHCPMMSLPYVFGTDLETIPAETPYFSVPDEAKDQAARFYESNSAQGPRIGLVWAGNPRPNLRHAHLIDRRRSLAPQQFQPIIDARPDALFVSLQKDADLTNLPETLRDRLADPMPQVRDFMDTAALIEQLDLVITVDTAVAHLAGALGKPVWILSRFDACWRWLGNAAQNPWYPSARIFGQKTPNDWTAAISEVAEGIRTLRS